MTIPLWCLFVAAVMPYIWFTLAAPLRAKQLGASFDTHTPRLQDPELRDRAARAQGAHQNSLEALAYFGPAVVVAHLAGANPIWSARLAIAFIVCRLLHGALYIGDVPPARTAVFALGLLSAISLFVLGAVA